MESSSSSSVVEERNRQNDNNNNNRSSQKKQPKTFLSLLNRWKHVQDQDQEHNKQQRNEIDYDDSNDDAIIISSSSDDNNHHLSEKSPKTNQFKKLLSQWNDYDHPHGSASFVITDPCQRSGKKTSIKMENERSIKNYKEKNIKHQKKNLHRRVPSRGMSIHTKPHTLKDIFPVEDDSREEQHNKNDENNMYVSSDGHSATFSVKDKSDVDMIRKAVGKNLVFDQMEDANELGSFIDAFEHIEVAKGLNVVTQGDPGDFFYIIGKDSSVAFELNGVQVGEAGEGGSFGELALMYSCPRAATVIATSSPTNLFRVGRNTFKSLLQEQTKRKEAEKIDLLKAVDFLSAMSEFDLNRLARAMTLNVFKCDDVIVNKGDEGDAFYIVYEGQLQVTDISVGSTKFDDITLESGDYFGERALATNEPRAANIIAATKGSAFRIDRKTFERVLGKFNRVIMKAQDRKIMVSYVVLNRMNGSSIVHQSLSRTKLKMKFEYFSFIIELVLI